MKRKQKKPMPSRTKTKQVLTGMVELREFAMMQAAVKDMKRLYETLEERVRSLYDQPPCDAPAHERVLIEDFNDRYDGNFMAAKEAFERGEAPQCPETKPCLNCDGTGTVLTEAGIEVCEAIRLMQLREGKASAFVGSLSPDELARKLALTGVKI